jgi:predicted  nucleic acid-binding Zn-ribbon protein
MQLAKLDDASKTINSAQTMLKSIQEDYDEFGSSLQWLNENHDHYLKKFTAISETHEQDRLKRRASIIPD